MRISDWSSDVCSSDLPRVEWCLTPFDARCGVSGLHYGHAVQVEPASTEERAAMARALEEARAAGRAGEVPVGAVVLVDGAVVAAAGNERRQIGRAHV